MKKLLVLLTLLFSSTALAYGTVTVIKYDAGAKLALTKSTDAGVSVVTSPDNAKEAVDMSFKVFSAIKDHAWWLATGFGIFLLMFIMNAVGLFEKIGSNNKWLVMWILSILAGLFFAFNDTGFGFNTFLQYVTAGPVAASIRDFFKDYLVPKFFKKDSTV